MYNFFRPNIKKSIEAAMAVLVGVPISLSIYYFKEGHTETAIVCSIWAASCIGGYVAGHWARDLQDRTHIQNINGARRAVI